MLPDPAAETSGESATAAPTSSNNASKCHVPNSVAQVIDTCQLLYDAQGKRTQAGDEQITHMQLSEALSQQQQKQTSDKFSITLFRVLSAAHVLHSLQELDLSYNSLGDAFWCSSDLSSSTGGRWLALTSVNLANNMYRRSRTYSLLQCTVVLCTGC